MIDLPSLSNNKTDRSSQDEWLFGWDATPGIVSIWADRSGQALIWQRLSGSGLELQISCQRDTFRPWLFAATLEDLEQLGSSLVATSYRQAALDKLPFSYQKLNTPSSDNTFCYLLSAKDGQALEREIIKGARKRLGKEITGLRDLPEDYYRVGPVEQYLMATGKAYFRGMVYADLHRLQFDLETSALDPKQGRIFLIAVHDSKGFSTVLEAPSSHPQEEREMIQQLCRIIRERDPDVIENHNLFGFDLPFLEERARTLGVPLEMARKEAPARIERYQEPLAYRRGRRTRYNLAGRELVDTLDAVLRHSFSARDMNGHGLKAAARYFGVATPERTYIPGAKVYETYRRDPEMVRRYALDDVLEVDGLSQRLMGAPFALAQMAPRPYGRLGSAGPAMGILEPMLVRAYLRAEEALPCYPKAGGGELGPHAGGATILYSEGVARQVVKADIASMYPSIMRTFQIGPRSDRLRVLLFLVSRLTDLRLEHKQALKLAPAGSSEAYQHFAMHSAMKILINSGYGYTGAGSMALFADRNTADEITRRGREILNQLANTLKEKGMTLLEADTDGIFFAVDNARGWDEAEERALVAEVATTLPPGLKLEYEGRYQSMLSHEVKNYALLTYENKLILRGVAFRSIRSEPFGVKFLQKAVHCCLLGDIVGLQKFYHETVASLLEHRLDPSEVATVARLAKEPDQYLKSRNRLKEASYEALLASGRNHWRVGERVRFYRGEDGSSILLPEESEDDEQSDEDETGPRETAHPGEIAAIFEGTQDAEEGAAIANRKQTIIITEAAQTLASLAPLTEAEKSSRRNQQTRPRYDAEHYLKVLHTSYVSRLRKAFSAEDFEQLFRVGGQLGLFDRPLHQIQPAWIS